MMNKEALEAAVNSSAQSPGGVKAAVEFCLQVIEQSGTCTCAAQRIRRKLNNYRSK